MATKSFSITLLALILAGCGGAGGPGTTPVAAPPPSIASEADPRLEAYKPDEWPAAGPLRDGIELAAVVLPGWRRARLDIDPRLGQAELAFAAAAEAEARIFARIRLHDSAEAAREDLLARMRAATASLQVFQGIGDIAYAAQSPAGLSFLAAARGNVTFSVRAPELDADALELVQTIDLQSQQSPAVAALSNQNAPRFVGAALRQAETGRARPLGLSFAPGAPPPAALAFDCSEPAAGVVLSPEGPLFSSAKAGLITLRGYACSDQLRRSVFSLRVSVSPSSIDAAFQRAREKDQRVIGPGVFKKQPEGIDPQLIKERAAPLQMKKVDKRRPGGN